MQIKIISNLSVDCVIFGFDSKELQILLVERTLKNNSISFSDYTLTGNHVLEGEDPDEAAVRILKNLTGLDNIYLEQFHMFGSPNRLMKEKDRIWVDSLGINVSDHVVSIGYFSLIDSSKAIIAGHENRVVKWFPINQLPELGFDHQEIIALALEKLRIKVRQEPVCFELLPEKFTLTQVQKLYEAIMGTTFDARNFRKKTAQMKYLIPLNEKQIGVRHKPAQLYLFSKDVYERTKKERFDISL